MLRRLGTQHTSPCAGRWTTIPGLSYSGTGVVAIQQGRNFGSFISSIFGPSKRSNTSNPSVGDGDERHTKNEVEEGRQSRTATSRRPSGGDGIVVDPTIIESSTPTGGRGAGGYGGGGSAALPVLVGRGSVDETHCPSHRHGSTNHKDDADNSMVAPGSNGAGDGESPSSLTTTPSPSSALSSSHSFDLLVGSPSHLVPPTPIAHFRSPDYVLAQRAVDYVAKRREKLFEEMLVYNGGTVDDKETLGEHMIMRNFFHFAMYHKKWGFYPRQFRKYRDLVTSGFFDPIPFANLRSQADYDHYVAKINESNPVFISPTQLFQPYYGWVFAEYVMGVVRAKFVPGETLVIYDVGAGTGAFAESFLNYLAEFHPHFYELCEYHLIEVSPSLVQLQRTRLVHHFHQVRIHNCSILNWKVRENRRCMVIGIELLSTMPHDHVLWLGDGACYEHWVTMLHPDNLSTANERHLQLRDPAILRYLRYLDWMREETQHTLRVLCQTDGRENIDPLRHETIEPTPYDSSTMIANKIVHMNNPFRQAYIPTASMMMLEVLAEFFPRHHALFADWSEFTEGINGINGPLIQTKKRIGKDMYIRRCSSKLNENLGMVDVCFPTDFAALQKVYTKLFGVKGKEVSVMTHADFWATFGGDKTAIYTTKSGYNPLVQDFPNFKVFSSHHVDGVDAGLEDEH